MSFYYGQKHRVELTRANKNARGWMWIQFPFVYSCFCMIDKFNIYEPELRKEFKSIINDMVEQPQNFVFHNN